jgi:hypothetical protein
MQKSCQNWSTEKKKKKQFRKNFFVWIFFHLSIESFRVPSEQKQIVIFRHAKAKRILLGDQHWLHLSLSFIYRNYLCLSLSIYICLSLSLTHTHTCTYIHSHIHIHTHTLSTQTHTHTHSHRTSLERTLILSPLTLKIHTLTLTFFVSFPFFLFCFSWKK